MKKMIAYLKLFFDLAISPGKRQLFFGSKFNRNMMYRKYGIVPFFKVKKVAVLVNLDGEEKVHIIEEKIN